MPREYEVVNALDESFNTRLERALAQEATGSLSLESSRSLPRSPVSKQCAVEEGYLSDDDKFKKLLDKKLVEEQEKLEREGIPAQDGIPLIPITMSRSSTLNSSKVSTNSLSHDPSSLSSLTNSEDKENEGRLVRKEAAASATASAVAPAFVAAAAPAMVAAAAPAMVAAAFAPSKAAASTAKVSKPPSLSSRSRETFVIDDPVTIMPNPNESVVADLPLSSRPSSASIDRRTRVLETSAVSTEEENNAESLLPAKTVATASVDAAFSSPSASGASELGVYDKKLKTPRKAGGKKLAAGTPMVAAKSDSASLLGGLGNAVGGALSNTMDPRQLKDNNRSLAAELNKARLDMREMHDRHQSERQDLVDEIVRLRQLAGEKDDGVREMLELRVEKALTCHNGALAKVATLLGDDVPTKLHCRISFILENIEKLKDCFDGMVDFLFSGDPPTGKYLQTFSLIQTVFDNTKEHDDMIRNFIEKLSDAQLNLQLALEDDVDFLSSSAMPTIMNPLNASTMHHDKTRLPQILSDKTEALQRNGFAAAQNEGIGEDDGSHSQTPHELSNVIEEDESKRASSYLLARKRSSAITRRTSIAPQRQSNENEEVVRRSRNSRRESMRLSSGFPQAICKSPRVSELQGGVSTTPSNKSMSNEPDSPTSVDGSIDVLDRPVLSPTLSLKDESLTPLQDKPVIAPIDLDNSVHDATSTESNDMDLTTPEVAPSAPSTAGASALSSDPKLVEVDIGCSSFGDDSVDSLITPSTRRTSSFVRLYATPPDESVEGRKSLPLPTPIAREDVVVDKIPPAVLVASEDEEPQVKKMKTSSKVAETLPPPAATTMMAPPDVPVEGRGSRKSKMTAALHLKETSFNDSAVFTAPAPPKPKAAPKKKEGSKKENKDAEKKSAEDDQEKRTSQVDRASKGQKIGDVDMDTYKKMVVGQKAKPPRSKSRKLSKSEEQEIRAAAEVKAKSKPLEYAAFDASSRFGEGLSFLDETHVPTLTEFKKKQLSKPLPTSNASATAETSKKVVPAVLAKSASSEASTAPQPAVMLTVDGFKSASGRASSVSEDFLTSGTLGPSKGKGKGGRGKRRSKSTSGTVDDNDDDDFAPKKPKKSAAKKSNAAKKMTKKQKDEDIFHSPLADDVVENLKGKGKRKKSSSQFFSCDDGESGDKPSSSSSSSSVPSPPIVSNPAGRRRGRGVQKNYAEPPVNSKMRR